MTNETVTALFGDTVKTFDKVSGDTNNSLGRKPLEKQFILARSQT